MFTLGFGSLEDGIAPGGWTRKRKVNKLTQQRPGLASATEAGHPCLLMEISQGRACSACSAPFHTSQQDWPFSCLFPPGLSQRAAVQIIYRTMRRLNRGIGRRSAARKGKACFGGR